MREVVHERDGVGLPLLVSDVIPTRFVHGFTTRRGGVSPPPFEAFNLGMKWGDTRDAVLENRRRLLAATGVARLAWATQVHGVAVARVDADAPPDEIACTEADALVARDAGLAVAVYVADCVPILFADPVTGAFAATHAGWRGTVAGVAAATVERLRAEFGVRPPDLRVAMGPSIGPCCFEVGPEVVAAVEAVLPDARAAGVVVARAPRPHVDLWTLNARLLERAGLARANIDAAPPCTSCHPARFYSYRRDRGRTGQHLGFIGLR